MRFVWVFWFGGVKISFANVFLLLIVLALYYIVVNLNLSFRLFFGPCMGVLGRKM